MGLEGVELVMAIEEAFGISISDEEAGKTTTPGMLIEIICTKIRMSDKKTCASQIAFYKLRRALIERFDLKRNDIHPSSRLRDLFPVNDVREFWYELKKDVGATVWPKMIQPLWMLWLIFAITIAAFVAVFIISFHAGHSISNGFFIAVIMALLTAVLLFYLTEPFRKAVPPGIERLSKMVCYVMTSPQTEWKRAEVAEKVKRIVMEQLGVQEIRYKESADFVRDLGMD